MRRVIQIAATEEETIIALCEDGSMWALIGYFTNQRVKWQKLPGVPDHAPTKKYLSAQEERKLFAGDINSSCGFVR